MTSKMGMVQIKPLSWGVWFWNYHLDSCLGDSWNFHFPPCLREYFHLPNFYRTRSPPSISTCTKTNEYLGIILPKELKPRNISGCPIPSPKPEQLPKALLKIHGCNYSHTLRLFQPGNVHPPGSHKEPLRCLAGVYWFNFPVSHGNFGRHQDSHISIPLSPHFKLLLVPNPGSLFPSFVGFCEGCLFTKSWWRLRRGKTKPSKA